MERLPTRTECDASKVIELHSSEGYISSQKKDSTIDSFNCPWLIKAQQGQQVDISMVDFNPSKEQNCVIVGYLFDEDSKQNITICKPRQRDTHLHLSRGKSIKIQIVTDTNLNKRHGMFLINYKGKYESQWQEYL